MKEQEWKCDRCGELKNFTVSVTGGDDSPEEMHPASFACTKCGGDFQLVEVKESE